MSENQQAKQQAMPNGPEDKSPQEKQSEQVAEQQREQQPEPSAQPGGVGGQKGAATAKEKLSSSADKKQSKKRKREPTKSLSEFYQWDSADALLHHFALPESDVVAQAREQLQEEAVLREVTLDDVLALPANVVNQRQVDKLIAIEKKYSDAVDAALKAAHRLIATAQVHKAQREAQALKDQLDAERKAAKRQKSE